MSTFLQHFTDVIEDELFIGTSTQDLQQEIQQNMWSLSKPIGLNEAIQDWLDLINHIIENRTQQIAKTGRSRIFYLWFDEQASQLRFNLINDSHQFLPFNTNVEIVPTFNKIVEEFWTSPYHDSIPFDELDDSSPNETTADTSINDRILRVYKTDLNAQ